MVAAVAPLLPDDPPPPRLRDDLQLFPGPADHDGAPSWSIFDPVRSAYFRIDWRVMEIISRWGAGGLAAIAAAVSAETTCKATAADVAAVAQFLQGNELTVCDDPVAVARLAKRAGERRRGWLHQALHGYLFFRIPLLRPDHFLTAVAGWVAPLFSPAWRRMVFALGIIGLFLASRQWDAFVGGLAGLASWEGAVELAVTLAVIKILHEFGHACAAKRHGCPVPTMGAAFLVLWPVLYTDTTHAYRLTSRRQRLEIVAAGVMVELYIAALATFIWAILPPGALRDAAQTAAAVSWIGTLVINLNPLMRFDGYYLLADALNMPNLQDRAFAIAKWRLREALFGLEEPPPEEFAPRLRRILIVYAFSTWIYRFFLFLGVAVLVYQMAFKLLGLFLMGVEIVYFIALPIWRELAAWWSRRRNVGFNRHVAMTLLGALGVVALLAWPLPWPVKAPAVLQPADSVALYAPAVAQVSAVRVVDGGRVAAGAPLIELASPELSFEAERTRRRIVALEALIERESAVSDGADRVGVLREELQTARALALGVQALQVQLTIAAPMDGWLSDLADPLHPGQWVRPEQVLGRVTSADRRRVTAFVAADDLPRLAVGAAARFIADDPAMAAVPLRLESLAAANTDLLDIHYLSAQRGGPIPTVPVKGGRERPAAAIYRATLTPVIGPTTGPDAAPWPPQTVAGRVFIDGPPLGLAERAWRAAAAVLIRESGF